MRSSSSSRLPTKFAAKLSFSGERAREGAAANMVVAESGGGRFRERDRVGKDLESRCAMDSPTSGVSIRFGDTMLSISVCVSSLNSGCASADDRLSAVGNISTTEAGRLKVLIIPGRGVGTAKDVDA